MLVAKTRWLIVLQLLILPCLWLPTGRSGVDPNRDGVTRDFAAPTTWPATLKETWKVTVGEGHSSPVTSEGRIYVLARQGEDEVVLCLGGADRQAALAGKLPCGLHHESGGHRPRQGSEVHAGCERREALYFWHQWCVVLL